MEYRWWMLEREYELIRKKVYILRTRLESEVYIKKKKNTDRRENGSNGNLKRSKSEKKLDRKHYKDYNDLKIRKTEE